MIVRFLGLITVLFSVTTSMHAESITYNEVYYGYAHGYHNEAMSMDSGNEYNYPVTRNVFIEFSHGKEFNRLFFNKIGFAIDGQLSRSKLVNSGALSGAVEMKFMQFFKFQLGMGFERFDHRLEVGTGTNEYIAQNSWYYLIAVAGEWTIGEDVVINLGYRHYEGTSAFYSGYSALSEPLLDKSMVFGAVGLRL